MKTIKTMKEQIEKIIDRNTEGNYLLSSTDKAQMVSEILDLFGVSGSKVHRITQIQKHLENGDIKFTRTPLFEPPKLIIGCDLAAEGTSDYSVTWMKTAEHQESTNPPLLIASVDDMLRFINALRQTDRYIEMIYMNGACYQFHLMLKKFAPECEPYISDEKDHVITKYAGRYYDITGEVSGNGYTPMTESEIDMASGWSFHRTKVIQICECPACGEPIVV